MFLEKSEPVGNRASYGLGPALAGRKNLGSAASVGDGSCCQPQPRSVAARPLPEHFEGAMNQLDELGDSKLFGAAVGGEFQLL